jgi:hypothetical protein
MSPLSGSDVLFVRIFYNPNDAARLKTIANILIQEQITL